MTVTALNRLSCAVTSPDLSVQLGLRDIAGIRESLTECATGGAAPFSVAATNRALLEAYRQDPEIDRLLDDLHDGARITQS